MASITIILSAYNEEMNLENAVNEIFRALGDYDPELKRRVIPKDIDYEIVIFNDCSTDRTGDIANRVIFANRYVNVVHNQVNRGFGYNFFQGMRASTKDYVLILPGDGEIPRDAIRNLIRPVIHPSDMFLPQLIIAHTINMEDRPYTRRQISRLFTFFMNAIFKCELQYYNGPVVYNRQAFEKHVELSTTGFTFNALSLVQMILAGCSFMEVGTRLARKREYKSSAFRLSNIVKVFYSVGRLVWHVYVSKKIKIARTLQGQPQLNRVFACYR